MGRGSFEEELLSKIASGELGRFQQGSEETRVEALTQTQCSREDRRPSSPQRPGQPHGPGGRGLPVRVSADPMIKAGSLGKRPKGTGHASGQDRPWRTGDSTGENRRPGAGAPLAPPPRRARAPARPTLRYARRAPAVSLPPSNQGRTLSPWLRDRSVSVLSVNSFRLGGGLSHDPQEPCSQAGPGAPAGAVLGRSKPNPTRHLPGQSCGARLLLQLQTALSRRGAVNTPTTARPYFLCPQ